MRRLSEKREAENGEESEVNVFILPLSALTDACVCWEKAVGLEERQPEAGWRVHLRPSRV